MQATNRPAKNSGTATFRSSDGICQAITGTAATSSATYSQRLYQRGWSKHRMKVTRYSDSGSTQRNGTLAMFCVTWLVTASSITEPIADRPSHMSWVLNVGAAAAARGASAAALVAGASSTARRLIQPVAAHTTTKAA